MVAWYVCVVVLYVLLLSCECVWSGGKRAYLSYHDQFHRLDLGCDFEVLVRD